MGGRGATSGISSAVSGVSAEPDVYKGMVSDKARMILLELNPPTPVQIVIRKSFREGKETVELINNAITSLKNFGISTATLNNYVAELNKSIINDRQKIASGKYSKSINDVNARIEAATTILNKLKILAKEQRKKGIK